MAIANPVESSRCCNCLTKTREYYNRAVTWTANHTVKKVENLTLDNENGALKRIGKVALTAILLVPLIVVGVAVGAYRVGSALLAKAKGCCGSGPAKQGEKLLNGGYHDLGDKKMAENAKTEGGNGKAAASDDSAD